MNETFELNGKTYKAVPVIVRDDRVTDDGDVKSPCTGCAFEQNATGCQDAPPCIRDEVIYVEVA